MSPFLPPRLVDPTLRYVVSTPYGLPEQGVILHDHEAEIAIVGAPVCACHDMALAMWLSQPGVYCLTDPSGTHARVGEGGTAIERILHHRTHPPMPIVWMTAILDKTHPFPEIYRLYLENEFACRWVREGNTLVSTHFQKEFPTLSVNARERLDEKLEAAYAGRRLIKRVIDRNIDELRPLADEDGIRLSGPPLVWRSTDREKRKRDEPCRLVAQDGELVPHCPPWGGDLRTKRYPPGTILRLDGGGVSCVAIHRDDHVELQPGSTIRLDGGIRFGRQTHEEIDGWIRDGRMRRGPDGVGLVMRPIPAASLASLAKRVTGGRRRNARAWQVVKIPHL